MAVSSRSRCARALPLVVTGLLGALAGDAAAAPGEALDVPGLQAEVEILTDRWGVPHIYARSADDAFFAQGFQAARDRLWQMDLWRKRGLGQMARDFGPAFVEGDRLARAFLYRGDMYREWLAYGSDAKRVASAFVAGVNAFVALTERKPELLPLEFRLLGYRPARWEPADVVRIRHHGLTLNFTSEVERAAAYCQGAETADWLRRELSPPVQPKVPPGLDLCGLPTAALAKAYALATAPPRFAKGSVKVALELGGEPARGLGSNNWVIAPGKTTTGRPILANDPHRAHGAPSLRYLSHLVAPGFDVIGAGEPFLPGLSIGHNGTIAFGLTRFYIDHEDLYVYDLNPKNPDEYRYQDRFERFSTSREGLEVKGQPPSTVVLKFTRHGPVLYEDRPHNRAYALRAAWLEPGMAPYFGSIDYMRAQSWDQFRAAMNRWGAPAENQVYADKQGNIGWIPAGLAPIRPNWDGLFPVPGDGRYEWAGFRDMDELPQAYNPARGYVVTANENNIPAGHPAAGKGLGYEWTDSSRAQRLSALLAAKGRFSIADSQRMQTDTVSLPALRVVKLLAELRAPEGRIAQGLALLRGWDGDERADSAPAALFEVWFDRFLRPATLKAVLGEAGAKLAAPGDAARVIALLESPGKLLTAAQRDALLLTTLGQALEALAGRLGSDPAKWRWGDLHQARFEHPLRAVVDDDRIKTLDVGPWPIGGSAFTPMATQYRSGDYALTVGASFRMIIDVGRWDSSLAINTPGQSGNPGSPHYRDLAPLWAAGRYFPLLYSRRAIEKATTARLVLRPAPPPAGR
jgi:penicillin amidase